MFKYDIILFIAYTKYLGNCITITKYYSNKIINKYLYKQLKKKKNI